jgi:hypothetical protein
MAKKTVKFKARTKESIPVNVGFKTADGKPVKFKGHKTVTTRKTVKFKVNKP